MKKVLISFVLVTLLTGCAETMALIGPASTGLGSGNLARTTLTSAVDFGIKKSTGKSSIQHALNFAEKQNPERKKIKCVSFLESTDIEVCKILKNRVSELKRKIDQNSKIKILD